MAINSCLYEGTVMHARLFPRRHRFTHRVFMFWLDLDEAPALDRSLTAFSLNRSNFYSLYEKDHLPISAKPLKQRILDHLAGQGIDMGPHSRVMLLTNLRILGYVFNPVSFYFCFDGKNRCQAVVAEVGNTFGEMKTYLIRPSEEEASQFHHTESKFFYVSPFSDLDARFEFRLSIPEENLFLGIDTLPAGNDSLLDEPGQPRKVLVSTLQGRRTALTNANLIRLTVKYPLMTLRVIFLIHWHALLLALRGLPFHAKQANSHLQRQVLKPHRSTPKKESA